VKRQPWIYRVPLAVRAGYYVLLAALGFGLAFGGIEWLGPSMGISLAKATVWAAVIAMVSTGRVIIRIEKQRWTLRQPSFR
jgi:hypothetical protein